MLADVEALQGVFPFENAKRERRKEMWKGPGKVLMVAIKHERST
jgi:hypothetical protein